MPNKELHLLQRFATEEARKQFAQTVRAHGVNGAMKIYGISNRGRFERFVKLLLDSGEFCQTPSPLSELRGGQKHMFLRQHRDTILDCQGIFGKEFCMEHFYMEENTLDELERVAPSPEYKKQTHAERAELKSDTALNISKDLDKKLLRLESRLESIAEAQRGNLKLIHELEELFHQFVENTSNQIGKALIAPLLQSLLSFEGNMPERKDELGIDTLVSQATKQVELIKEADNGNKMRPRISKRT